MFTYDIGSIMFLVRFLQRYFYNYYLILLIIMQIDEFLLIQLHLQSNH